MKNPIVIAALFSFCLASHSQGADMRSTIEDQTAVAVTIYNDDLALIKDRRKLQLNEGTSQLEFRGVSARMRAETAMLRQIDDPESLRVLEQNFDFDLLSPETLLEKYIGKTFQIARMNPATGEETVEEATVLATNAGVVVKIGDRIETNPPGRFIFRNVPANLRDEPTLSIQLQSAASATGEVELSYLTGGLNWEADYVAELDESDTKLDLLAWVTLTNVSGATYTNASMQLVAGDVNQVYRRPKNLRRDVLMEAAGGIADSMVEESLFEYHLYTLERPTTISDNQTKQVSLLSASSIPAVKELLFQGQPSHYRSSLGAVGRGIKPEVFIEFENRKKAGLGMPLPKGIVRVYKRDSTNNAQFIGEDEVDHTARNEKVRLKLGESFDVTADKTQTDFQIKEQILGRDVFESSYEMKLRNAKSKAVTVVVREPIPGDWKMIAENLPHKKVAAGMAEWTITVPAEGETILTYTTRFKL